MGPSSTCMLVEIAGAEAVEAALVAGADLVASPAALAQTLVATVAGRSRTAVLAATPDEAAAAQAAGVDIVLALLHADRAPDLAGLAGLAAAGYPGAVLGVSPGSAGRLLQHAALTDLQAFAQACRRHGLAPGFAGGLEPPDVPRLMLLDPAILCVHGRPTRLRQFRALIAPPGDPAADGPTDRIFVHDLILPVRIGAYAHEHAATQTMRFSVDALVTRAARPVRDMRDIISYDIISDNIRLLATAGHVDLVEVLAERIAAAVLRHPRVVKVSVLLEKLETGSGRVGVAIERTRTDRGSDKGQTDEPAHLLGG